MSPGAWEGRKPELLIGIPHTGLVTIDWALELAVLWRPSGTSIRGWRGVPIDVARNRLVKDARELGVRRLFFLDSDNIAEAPNAIQRLISQELPIVSGLYYSKKGYPGMWRLTPDGRSYNAITQFPTEHLIEVDAIGMGCCLIDLRVFDRIQEPWFEWQIKDPEHQDGVYSEDFVFCRKARAAGFRIYVQTGIRFRHEQMVAWDPLGKVVGPHAL